MNMQLVKLTTVLVGLASLFACGGTPGSPIGPSPDNPASTARVVPIYLSAWGCLVCPQPRITAVLEGRTLTNGYHIFNLMPGTYELVGTLTPSGASQLDDRDRWDIAFTTFPQLGSPPEISDNGVEINSIASEAGPNASVNRSECGVFYRLPGRTSQQFRIRFRVTATRAAGVTCPVQYRG